MIKLDYPLNDYLQTQATFQVKTICTFDQDCDQSLYFINKACTGEQIETIEQNTQKKFFIIKKCTENKKLFHSTNVKVVDSPRLCMARLLTHVKNTGYTPSFLSDIAHGFSAPQYDGNSQFSYIYRSAKIHSRAIIEPCCYIGDHVVIDEGAVIQSGARIRSNTYIGKNSIIGSNTVIGGPGFGIEKDENNNNLRLPHLGGVYIGDHVEIGSFDTVCSGTIAPTVVQDYVHIDDHVHVAHNVTIKKNSLIVAGTIIGGSCTIEENVWLGINSSIHQGLKIGENALIGMGAVVLKNVERDSVIIGNPGKKLKNSCNDSANAEK